MASSILLPSLVNGNPNPIDTERRKRYEIESKNDLKSFLAEQAKLNPRLSKMLSRKKEPLVSIVNREISDYGNNPNLVQKNAEPHLQTPHLKSPSIVHSPIPNQEIPKPNVQLPYQPPMFYNPHSDWPIHPHAPYNPYPYQQPSFPYMGNYYRPPVALPPINNHYHNPFVPNQSIQYANMPSSNYPHFEAPINNQQPSPPKQQTFAHVEQRSPQQLVTAKKLYLKNMNPHHNIWDEKSEKETQKQKYREELEKQIAEAKNRKALEIRDRYQYTVQYLHELEKQIHEKQIKSRIEKEREKHLDYIQEGPESQSPTFHSGRRMFYNQKNLQSSIFPPDYHNVQKKEEEPRVNFNFQPPPASKPNNHSLFPPLVQNNQEYLKENDNKSHLRGIKAISELPAWQQDEIEKKKRQKQDIQDVLLKQIAEKEDLKKKKLAESKMEDEREQKRLENERQLLHERYAREKEEQRVKEEQDRLENEKRAKEIANQAEKSTKREKPQPAEQIQERYPDKPENTVPFRSDSPPIPTILKKIKSNGDVGEEEVKEVIQPSNPEPQPKSPLLRKIQVPAENSQDRDIVLDQLSAIQQELENEARMVQFDLNGGMAALALKPSTSPKIQQTRETVNLDHKYYPPLNDQKYTNHIRRISQTHYNRVERTKENLLKLDLHSPWNKYNETPRKSSPRFFQDLNDFRKNEKSKQPSDDDFNIDEIERLNNERLRKLNTQNHALISDDEKLMHFVLGRDSLATSTSEYQRIPDALL